MKPAINSAPRVAEVTGVTPEVFAREIVPGYRPVVMRGLAAHWPAVAAGRGGVRPTSDYLRRFDGGRPVRVFAGAPEIGGRFFYRDDHRGVNFQTAQILLPLLLDALVAEAGRPQSAALYAGSASAAEHYPGWAEANPLPLPVGDATPRLWVGNASRVTTHYDMSDNVAVVVAGRRRFALFPPDQLSNLYVGPLENTLAGQPVSMVDLEAPDFARFPRFADALAAMQVAELEPGDALFIPSLWWHDVRATGALNVLANYWWGTAGDGSAFAALIHAVLGVRDLPPGARDAMRSWFDHYVFDADAGDAAGHLPPHARGVLGPPTPERDRFIRDYLRRTLDRG